MAYTVKVEVRFTTTGGFYPGFTIGTSEIGGDDIIVSATVWVDITADVSGPVSIDRARQRDIDEFSPGQVRIPLEDPDRNYDPTNESSPYYGNIQPGRLVRVSATVDAVDYPLFTGRVTNWPTDYGTQGQSFALVQIDGVDPLARLAVQELDEIAAAHTGDTSGARVSRVLDLAEVDFPAGERDIDAGRTILGNTTFGSNALAYLQKVAVTELGALFAAADGTLTFRERYGTLSTVAATFSDDGDAAACEYTAVTQDFDIEQVWNRIPVAGVSGTVQVAADDDADRLEAFGIRNLSGRTDLLMRDDSDAANHASWLLHRFKLPELRFDAVAVEVHQLEQARQVEMFSLDLGDRVDIERTPPGGGAQLVRQAVVDGLHWLLDPVGDTVTLTVDVSSGTNLFPFTIADDTFGEIEGAGAIGY